MKTSDEDIVAATVGELRPYAVEVLIEDYMSTAVSSVEYRTAHHMTSICMSSHRT
jgi:hypothetical protein